MNSFVVTCAVEANGSVKMQLFNKDGVFNVAFHPGKEEANPESVKALMERSFKKLIHYREWPENSEFRSPA